MHPPPLPPVRDEAGGGGSLLFALLPGRAPNTHHHHHHHHPTHSSTPGLSSSPLPPLPSSGAGKSTVAALLERLYSPDAGSITLAGQDIRGFSRTEWCAALAAVSQEPVLFPASIAYNIGGRAGWVASLRCT